MADKKTKKRRNKKAETPTALPPLLPEVVRKEKQGGSSLVPSDPLKQYLQLVRSTPRLSEDEVHQLAVRVHNHKDRSAAVKLVTAHLYTVVSIAFEFRSQFSNMLDLIQEGNIGLMRAVEKFDPFKGVKLSTYSAYWIRAYILKYLLDNWRLVRVGTTNMRRKLLFNLNRVSNELRLAGIDPGPKQLAAHFNATEEDVIAVQKSIQSADVSLDAQVGGEDDSNRTYAEVIGEESPSLDDDLGDRQMEELIRTHIENFSKDLSGSNRAILYDRLMSETPVTLAEIGEKFGVTREAIRQAEERLIKKLRNYLKEHIPGIEDFNFIERG